MFACPTLESVSLGVFSVDDTQVKKVETLFLAFERRRS